MNRRLWATISWQFVGPEHEGIIDRRPGDRHASTHRSDNGNVAFGRPLGRRRGKARDSAPQRRQRREISQMVALKWFAPTAQNATLRRGCAALAPQATYSMCRSGRLSRLMDLGELLDVFRPRFAV
jgi:hypothetical protein